MTTGAPLPLVGRAHFLEHLAAAIGGRTGLAAGKLGISEIQRLNFSLAAAKMPRDAPLLRALEPHLVYHSLKQSALFPPDPDFYLRFNEFYVQSVAALDYLGVFPDLLARTGRLVEAFGWRMPLMDYVDQEPDRSSPADDRNCYLPLLAGRRVLIVCSFAEVLKARATRDVFEGVWAKTGKKWFEPAGVEALEFPFGYTAATHAQYVTSLDLYEAIAREMRSREFDVALTAAAGLGIPLASLARQMGKVGLSLGGHLQVVFGVLGKRWRAREDWRERYVNEWWIDMPRQYHLPEQDVADCGAYW
jgi:hypothetical protein